MHTRKEKVKLFSDKLIWYTVNPKGSGKKHQKYHLKLMNEFCEIISYKINIKILLLIIHIKVSNQKLKLRK